jgi:hypothetical protein
MFVGVYVLGIYLAIVAFIVYKKKLSESSGIIGLGFLGFFAGVMIMTARLNQGVAGALSSRYTAFSSLIFISAIILIGKLLTTIKSKPATKTILSLALLAGIFPAVVFSWHNGLVGMRTKHADNVYDYTCTRQQNPTAACLYDVYFPSNSVAKQDLNYIKKKHYSGY